MCMDLPVYTCALSPPTVVALNADIRRQRRPCALVCNSTFAGAAVAALELGARCRVRFFAIHGMCLRNEFTEYVK